MLEGDVFFFFNDTATTEIYTLSLHDALPISCARDEIEPLRDPRVKENDAYATVIVLSRVVTELGTVGRVRSEEHTSELQSRQYLVCRLLLEKKKKNQLSCAVATLSMIFTLYQ